MSLKKAFTKLGLLEDEVVVKKPLTAPVKFVAPVPEVVVDDTISKTLEQSLQDNKLSGFDYLKFMSATEGMKALPEETRFKMTAEVAKQVGVDKDSLIKSAQHYLAVLKENEAEFNTEFVQPENKSIQLKENKLADLETKIGTLTKQLEQAKEDHHNSTLEVQEKKTNLEAKKTAFQATLQTFVNNIDSNIEKINKYL